LRRRPTSTAVFRRAVKVKAARSGWRTTPEIVRTNVDPMAAAHLRRLGPEYDGGIHDPRRGVNATSRPVSLPHENEGKARVGRMFGATGTR
jgi:hypothetical protein